jgi:hypothetical protein
MIGFLEALVETASVSITAPTVGMTPGLNLPQSSHIKGGRSVNFRSNRQRSPMT